MINDPEGVQFLQWCLPRLHLRWLGFRKVRRQVYQRINRRLEELGVPNIGAYSGYLEDHPDEWNTLDAFCRISISRFYRDQAVYQGLEREVFPELVRIALGRGERVLRCWSAGCSGGEEPYTLALIWRECLASRFPAVQLQIMATDVDPAAIQRAKRGCYHASSLKQLPAAWKAQAFIPSGHELCLKDEYRETVTFVVQDLRERAPEGLFLLILCRNLAFTYFDEASQQETLERLTRKLAAGGALIIGKSESLSEGNRQVEPWLKQMGIYRKPLAQSDRLTSVSQG